MSIQEVIEQCVIPNCENCKEEYLPQESTVSLVDLNTEVQPFSDYLIAEQNNKFIQESLEESKKALDELNKALDSFDAVSSDLTLELTRERMECGADCLSTQDVPFVVKDTCMKAACGININLFYNLRDKICDPFCAQRCMKFNFVS